MRWMGWVPALLSVYALASPAAGFAPGCGGVHPAYGAGACAAPDYGWTQGCDEHPPSCCDNAWAGYCQEKARWEAHWRQAFSGHATASYARPVTVIYRQSTPRTYVETPQGQESIAPGVPRPAQPAAPTVAPTVPAPPQPGVPSAATPSVEPVPEPAVPKATWNWGLPKLW